MRIGSGASIPQERATVEAHFREAVQGQRRDYQAEYRIIRPSDGAGALDLGDRADRARRERQAGALIGAHLDITERKEAEAEQRLLMQELAHRVKNTHGDDPGARLADLAQRDIARGGARNLQRAAGGAGARA